MTNETDEATLYDLVVRARHFTRRTIDDLVLRDESSTVPHALADALESFEGFARSAGRVLAWASGYSGSLANYPGGRPTSHQCVEALDHFVGTGLETIGRPERRPRERATLHRASQAWGAVADLIVLNHPAVNALPEHERAELADLAVREVDLTARILLRHCQDLPEAWVGGRSTKEWCHELEQIISSTTSSHSPRIIGAEGEAVTDIVLNPTNLLARQRMDLEIDSPLVSALRDWQALANGVLRDPAVSLDDLRIAARISAAIAGYAHQAVEELPAPDAWPASVWEEMPTTLDHIKQQWRAAAENPRIEIISATPHNPALLETGRHLVHQLQDDLSDTAAGTRFYTLVKAAALTHPIVVTASLRGLFWLVDAQQLSVHTRHVRQEHTQLEYPAQYLRARKHGLPAPASLRAVEPMYQALATIAEITSKAPIQSLHALPPHPREPLVARATAAREAARTHAEQTRPRRTAIAYASAAHWSRTFSITSVPAMTPRHAPKPPPR